MHTTILAAPVRPVSELRTIRVALAGGGVVGGQLLALLRARADGLAHSRGVRIQLTRILVRRPERIRAIPLPPHALVTDVAEFLAAPADVVVEATGDVELAERIARASLSAGLDFVTANKALVAGHGPRLLQLARQHGAALRFEAAVAGGIPVIRVLREALIADDVQSITGILKGTTNYILCRMREGVSFAEALEDAQSRGFAEADPARDLDGRDATDKVRILAWLAFGIPPAALRVERRGLMPAPDALVAAAAAFGGAPRLLAECVRGPGGVSAAVEPVIVPHSSAFGTTLAADNLVRIDALWNGNISLGGPGAGGAATACALLADILDHARSDSHRNDGALSFAPSADDHRCVGETTGPGSCHDPRDHEWIVTVPAVTSRTLDVLAGAGIGIADMRQQMPYVHVRTARCTRARIDGALDRLGAAGLPATRLRVVEETRG
jgi:homoserine dehydrogenase